MKTIPITRNALHKRINRKLLKDGEKLFKTRSNTEYIELGEYYTIILDGNWIAQRSLGRL